MKLGPTHRTSVYLNCLSLFFFIYLLVYFIFGCTVSAAAQES